MEPYSPTRIPRNLNLCFRPEEEKEEARDKWISQSRCNCPRKEVVHVPFPVLFHFRKDDIPVLDIENSTTYIGHFYSTQCLGWQAVSHAFIFTIRLCVQRIHICIILTKPIRSLMIFVHHGRPVISRKASIRRTKICFSLQLVLQLLRIAFLTWRILEKVIERFRTFLMVLYSINRHFARS